MMKNMLQAKLHGITVTQVELTYDGSCAIDEELIEKSGMREYQAIDIYNITNGERFSTYIIKGERGSGMISINGAAARKAQVGDKVIIATYSSYTELELETYKPILLYFDASNNIISNNRSIPTQKTD